MRIRMFAMSKINTALYKLLRRSTFSIGLVILNKLIPVGSDKMYLIFFKSYSSRRLAFNSKRSAGV